VPFRQRGQARKPVEGRRGVSREADAATAGLDQTETWRAGRRTTSFGRLGLPGTRAARTVVGSWASSSGGRFVRAIRGNLAGLARDRKPVRLHGGEAVGGPSVVGEAAKPNPPPTEQTSVFLFCHGLRRGLDRTVLFAHSCKGVGRACIRGAKAVP